MAANDGLRYAVHRVAETGLLRVDEEFAAPSMTAAGVGATFTLLTLPEAERSLEHSVRMREAFVRSIVADHAEVSDAGLVGAAVALDALLDTTDALHPAERDLLHHWLQRLARPQHESVIGQVQVPPRQRFMNRRRTTA